MDNSLSIIHLRKYKWSYLIDMLALLCIYFIPTLSHLTGIPFYLAEPMRLFVILALLHSNGTNAYILAFTLPLFSFAVSAHPVFLKMLIISLELMLNVFLYRLLVQKKVSTYFSIFLSIAVSKIFYYLLKFILIQAMLFQTELVSTSITIQLLVTLVFSIYAFIILKFGRNSDTQ